MRRLKIVTTALLVFGVAVLFSYPFTVGAPPKKGTSVTVRKEYALRLTLFFGVTCFSLLGAATGAMMIARRVREQFAASALQNLADLITAEVQAKPKDGGSAAN